jgi:PAS domain S-box-containing protein
MAAFGVTAFLLILILLILQGMLSRPLADARLMNVAGSQRMYSQRLSKAALAVVLNSESRYVDELRDVTTQWTRLLPAVQQGSPELGLSGTQTPEITSLFSQIEPQYQAMIEAARCMLTIVDQGVAQSGGQPTRQNQAASCGTDLRPQLDRILAAESPFLQGMDGIVSELERQATGRIYALREVILLLFSGVLVLLALEGILIFRPAARRLRAVVADLVDAQHSLEASEQRFRTLVGSMDDIVFTLDLEQRFTGVYGRWLEQNGVTAEYFLGKTARERVNAQAAAAHEAANERALAGEHVVFEWSVEFRNGLRHIQTAVSPLTNAEGSAIGLVGVGRDITDLKQAEAEIRARIRQQAVVVRLGQLALIGTGLTTLMDELVALACRTLDVEFCKVLERIPDSDVMLLRAGFGWREGYVGRTTVSAGPDTLAGYTLALGEPVIVEDIRRTAQFAGSTMLHEHGVVSGMSVMIYGHDRPFGVLSVHTAIRRRFTQNDVNFLQAVSNVLAAAIERKGTEDALHSAKEAAEAASRAKGNFLANMSHELRTPLNSIIGMSQVLLMTAVGPLNEKQIEYTSDILVCGKHLLELINDVLDLSKAESNRIQLVQGSHSLASLLYEGLGVMKQRALTANLAVETDIDEDLPLVCCDRRRIVQVIFNLLSNAIKFTPEGGRIGIHLYRVDGQARIEVWDTGIGISPENQKRLFQPFERLDELSVSRQYEGTGLGLALSKQLIELHGGTIGVHSDGDGQGSSFWFTLPFEAA